MSTQDLSKETGAPDKYPTAPVENDQTPEAGGDAPAITFPDGGRLAWLNIVGCFLLSLTSYGQLNAFGTFTTFYVNDLLNGHSPSSISWIGSVQLVLTYFSGIALGRLFDSRGARVLLIPGAILSAFSLMMTSLSTKYYQVFLSHGVGLGLGIALQFYPLMAIPSHWFLKKRALAVGIVVSGSSLAGIIYPVMLSRLFREIGFPWAVRTLAFLNLFLQLVSIPLVSERLPRRMKLPLADLQVIREPVFLVYGLGGFLAGFGLFAPYWYIELFSLAKSLSPSFSFYTISIMNASALVGRVLTGVLADQIGKFNVLSTATFLSGLWSLVLWTTARSMGRIIAFCVLFGFTSGSVSSLAVACTGQLTPHPSRIGARVGMFSLFMAPGILTGPSIAGAILDSTSDDYVGLQVFIGLVLVLGSLCFLLARWLSLRSWGKF